MSLWVEVESVEKKCPVMINLDEAVEIAPLREGGCALFFPNPNVPDGKSPILVKDNYTLFKQFAMQTVSADSIADRISSIKKFHGVSEESNDSDESSQEAPRGRGRPKKESE